MRIIGEQDTIQIIKCRSFSLGVPKNEVQVLRSRRVVGLATSRSIFFIANPWFDWLIIDEFDSNARCSDGVPIGLKTIQQTDGALTDSIFQEFFPNRALRRLDSNSLNDHVEGCILQINQKHVSIRLGLKEPLRIRPELNAELHRLLRFKIRSTRAPSVLSNK